MKKVFILIVLIFTTLLPGCSDEPNFEGDKIIGTWVLIKRIDTLADTVEEFDVSEMKLKVIFYTDGKYKQDGSLKAEWRNLGMNLYRFSDYLGLINWSYEREVEFIGDNEMSLKHFVYPWYIDSYIKIE
ncbi:hypothetical protein [Aestuariivivens sediminis]|uniref:hypothetical protein n=1 Tax=Aestuariivivens sediminis TaxID=2913557 RepID=UPI001F573D3D|nr:hypothetical protein [Aestuariivivens sediminis]